MPGALAAARAGKRVLLANKEALVAAGSLFMAAVRDSGAELLPIPVMGFSQRRFWNLTKSASAVCSTAP